MKIKELDGLKRAGEFEGGIEIVFEGKPKVWTSTNTLKEALYWYLEEKCKPLGTNKTEKSVQSDV